MRFGLIGTGLMAQEHIRNLALLPEARVVGLADPVASSLDWARSTLGEAARDVACFGDAATMLRETAPEAVIIASPNHTHHAILSGLLGAGPHEALHILCEKPMATTMAHARDIVRRAAGHRGVFWVGMEYRFMPPVHRFIEQLEAGRVGTLRRIAMHEHRFPFLPKVGHWNRFDANTGGTMVEKCCHFFDLMRLIARSEPVRLFCSGAADVNHRDERYDGRTPDIIDNSFTVVDFASGLRAMLDLCMFAEGAEEQEQLVAIGDTAKLEVGIPGGTLTYSPRVPPGAQERGAPKRVAREHVDVDAALLAAGHHHGATFHQLRGFLDAAAGRGPVRVTARDGLMAVAMGLAAETSAREGRAVALSEILD